MNKTKVINSLMYMNVDAEQKQTDEYKEIAHIKSKLRKATKDRIEMIQHCYEELITLYWLSAKQQINHSVVY